MLIELGNTAPVGVGIDARPKVTSIHIPEADESGLGGYSHALGGITAAELKEELLEALLVRGGTTRLPDHEVLVSVLHPADGAWSKHGTMAPSWVGVQDHELTPEGRSDDVERVLADYWGVPTAAEFFNTSDPERLLVKKELTHWTRTAPGELPAGLKLPDQSLVFTNDGRSMSNINDGGGQVGSSGTGTAATATSFSTGATFLLNQWAGYRVYAFNGTGMVWANVISNTTGGVLTIDRWYAPATPGGAAGATPTSGFYYVLADGGMVSSWFVALATGGNAPSATDHSVATDGNTEITTAGGGLVRKIAPYAQTSGVSPRGITLTPVYTANGSDSLPAVVTAIGVFASMVPSFAQAGGPLKFSTALNASATLSAVGDQLTVTESIGGS